MTNVFAAATATVLSCATSVTADTLLVPSEFATIQAAIDAAVDGDEIVVSAFSYTSLNFNGKAITVRAEIEGVYPSTHGITFENGERADSIVKGFAVTAFTGIQATGASPTIIDCMITGDVNAADLGDSSARLIGCDLTCTDFTGLPQHALYAHGSGSPVLIDCTIHDVDSWCNGAGVLASSTSITFVNCIIRENRVEHDQSGGTRMLESALAS